MATNVATATEFVEETSDFLITRDFQRFRISERAAVFFKTRAPWGEDLPDAEIRDETRRLLATRFNLVASAAEARYELAVRLEEYIDYATRDAGGKPATGFVMFAICALPFKETSESCQNLTFYYFGGESRLTMFRRATHAWLAHIVTQ